MLTLLQAEYTVTERREGMGRPDIHLPISS
jgi:hypothetical protein